MARAERIFRHRNINERSVTLMRDFFLENFARPETLRNLPSVGMSTKRGPFHWVEAAYFLGKEEISHFKQNHNDKKAWTRFMATDTKGKVTKHYISVGNELPLVTLLSDPNAIQLAPQVNNVTNPAGFPEPINGGEIPTIHIPQRLRSGHRIGSKVKIDSAIFVEIPASVQRVAGVSLGATSFLIATRISGQPSGI